MPKQAIRKRATVELASHSMNSMTETQDPELYFVLWLLRLVDERHICRD